MTLKRINKRSVKREMLFEYPEFNNIIFNT